MLSLTGILAQGGATSIPVATDYESAVLIDNPLCYLKLNEASGTIAYDSSGNSNHGEYFSEGSNGKPPILAQSAIRQGNTYSIFCNYYMVYGWGNYVRIPKTSIDLSGDWSLEIWMKVTNLAHDSNIFGCSFNSSGTDNISQVTLIQGFVGNGPHNKFSVANYNSGYSAHAIADSNVSNNNTYHVCGVKEGSTLKLYVNGILQGTQGVALNTPYNNSGYIYINRSADESLFSPIQGTYSDAAIYDYALDATKIIEHYTWGT